MRSSFQTPASAPPLNFKEMPLSLAIFVFLLSHCHLLYPPPLSRMFNPFSDLTFLKKNKNYLTFYWQSEDLQKTLITHNLCFTPVLTSISHNNIKHLKERNKRASRKRNIKHERDIQIPLNVSSRQTSLFSRGACYFTFILFHLQMLLSQEETRHSQF